MNAAAPALLSTPPPNTNESGKYSIKMTGPYAQLGTSTTRLATETISGGIHLPAR